MNLNTRQPARNVGDEPSQPIKLVIPKLVGSTVKDESVNAGIAGQNLEPTPGRGVSVQNALDIGSQSLKHL